MKINTPLFRSFRSINLSARFLALLGLFAALTVTSQLLHAADPDENANWLQLKPLLLCNNAAHLTGVEKPLLALKARSWH